MNVMFPPMFRSAGNIKFSENVVIPAAGVLGEELSGATTADDVNK